MPNTFKSNGDYFDNLSGERVSNAWATYPLDGDNIPKGVLIPNVTAISHEDAVKDGLYL